MLASSKPSLPRWVGPRKIAPSAILYSRINAAGTIVSSGVGCKERAGSRSAPAPRLVNCKMPVTRLSIGGKVPSAIRSASAGAAGFAVGALRFVVGVTGLARAVSVIVVIVRVLVARGVGLGGFVVERWALDVRRLVLAGALSPAKPAFA